MPRIPTTPRTVRYGSHWEPAELGEAVRRCHEALDHYEEAGGRWDSLLVQGLSGTIPGAILAHARGKHLCVVRKPNERRHMMGDVDGWLEWGKNPYLVLDDFVETGATISHILSVTPFDNPPQAAILYAGSKHAITTCFKRQRVMRPSETRGFYAGTLARKDGYLFSYTEKEREDT